MSNAEQTLEQLFNPSETSSSPSLLDNHQLAHVAQLVFREDSLDAKMRIKIYDFILSDGNNLLTSNSSNATANDDDDDDDSDDAENDAEGCHCPFKRMYSRHKNSVRGFNDEILKLVNSTLEVFARDNAAMFSSASSLTFFVDELCGLCEHLASRLELAGPSASGFIASTVLVMFFAVVEEAKSHEKTNLKKHWSSTVFKLSFQFAEKHRYVLSSSSSSNNNNGIATTSSTNVNLISSGRDVALILLRLILQYHLPGIMRHCDQYQMPLCDWILDQWLLNQMMNLLFFVGDNNNKSDDNKKINKNLLAFFDFIIAARDPLIMFGLAVEALSVSQEKLKSIDDKDKFKAAFFSGNNEAFTAMSVDQQPRITMLHAQQLLRSTPRCAKNRLRHYFHGTRLLYPLPANNNMNLANEQNSLPSASEGSPTSPSSSSSPQQQQQQPFDERELYEGQVVLPVSNTELVEAFAMSMQDDGFTVNSNKKISGNKNDSDFDHHQRPLSFVILDCRSEKSFHFARLPTAIHVGADVGYDPELMMAMIERFEGARGSHMCVLGTGRGVPEEANLLKIIALRFVQAGFPFVSIAEEGFKGLIPMIKVGKVEVVKSQVPPVASPSSSPQQQQQQQQKQQLSQPRQNNSSNDDGAINSNSTKEPSSKKTEDLLKKAEETAKEAKETAAKWGKSLMNTFSGWSFGGNKSSSTAKTAATTTAGDQQPANNNTSKDQATKIPNNTNQKSIESSGTNNVSHDDREEISQEGGSDQTGQQQHQQQPQTFRAGGANSDEDDDDDELLSQLVTTVAVAPSPPKTSPSTTTTTTAIVAAVEPVVVVVVVPETEKVKPVEEHKTETTTGEVHHPFDDLFGSDE